MLKSLHADFYADGVTAMDTSRGLPLGVPAAYSQIDYGKVFSSIF